ncbi:Aste57867_3969 [Aphanomyces stellatus]|uniref:Aste57867_3969 protein n=1 Tax=Aphanomyces stellatus TaxID=120398 RepID=A0A485KBM9_9STRA|nr:hypothetical protein As57867_003958 [Aphanomyces stellatus]VFT81106.1 Aste57867_3969 [Aphanomyces stellatus]
MTSTELRTFASIVCRDCLYLEFPGCDSHQLLYTDSVMDGATIQAKCPKCPAATNNQRPFREGCRRCKGKTAIRMWNCSAKEISQAFRYFPPRVEEIDHTVLQCEEKCCASVAFPSSREVLTTRTAACALVTQSHRQLKVSNFQLSMPHVAGCPRQGMPLYAVAVRLPKSELKFVLERIDQCPLPATISVGPVYRKRLLAPPVDTNQLHQIYLRLLTTIVKTFDSKSLKALEPLKQIAVIFAKPDALRMFPDWAPPCAAPITHLPPTQAFATSQVDDQHDASQILDPGSTFWKSPIADSAVDVGIMFDPPVTIQSISLHWHPSFVCTNYTVAISSDGGKAYDAVAVVTTSDVHRRVTLPQAVKATHVKVTMTSPSATAVHVGLHALHAYEAAGELYYTPPNQLLQDLLAWISSATLSPHAAIRTRALSILQNMALFSGSLCALLHVVHCLLHSPDDDKHGDAFMLDTDDTEAFLGQLSQSIQKVMMRSNTCADNAKIEKRIIQQMSLSLQDEVTRRTIQILQNIPGLEVFTPPSAEEIATGGLAVHPSPTSTMNEPPMSAGPPPPLPPAAATAPVAVVDSEANTYPVLVLLLCQQQSFVKSIQTRAQLAMVLLSILSELSVWQMQRMQRPEDFVGRREDELGRLEDPFSIQVCPELFALCYQLLRGLLAPWLDPAHTDLHDKMAAAAAQFGRALPSVLTSQTLDHRFTPTAMGQAILQIITSNVRRLVLSHVNPADVGLEGQDPMIQSLEHLISLGTKRTDALFPLSLQAAAAIEVGMEAFYPSSQQRTHLLTTRMGHGATLEFQLRWPVQEREQEDPRYERLILLLQLACIQHHFAHALRGTWGVFLHLVVQLPADASTAGVLTHTIAECIQQAGFAAWQVVAGAQEISITLQRHLHWNRVEKMGHDSGSGWIRVYPSAVAAYDEVLTEVDAFVGQHTSLNM